jgi:uncharacterized protein (TIGR03067 family)
LGSDQTSQEEADRLHSTWKLARSEVDGEPAQPELIRDAILMIDHGKHTLKLGDVTVVGTHKIDPNKDPKTIDFQDSDGPFKGQVRFGIYRLDGDELTLCLAPIEQKRPKKFESVKGSGVSLDVWKRQTK